MEYRRILPPSEDIEREAEALAKAFFAQFDDDDVVPEGSYGRYLREHGSSELVKYLDEEQPPEGESTEDES